MKVSRSFVGTQRQQGMTLIEQIMVLAIVAILTGVAVPPMQHLLNRNQLRVAQTEFIGALHHTREKAILSGQRTVFCPTTDQARCDHSTQWEEGWLLGRDRNLDDQPDEGPLRVGPRQRGKLLIRSSAGRHIIRFHPDGSASGSNVTLLFCQPAHPADALVVVVSNAGRVRGAPANSTQIATCTHLK